MRIVVTHTEAALAQSWQQAVSARLPQATVFIDDTAQASATIAIGWSPGADFFTRHSGLRAFFSAAAGVEHVLHNPGLPLDLPVIRLEDAGMGRQMVEYCLHEVLRLRGRHSDYEQQHRNKVWRELVPLDRTTLRVGVFGVGVLGAPVARAFAQLGYPVTGYSRTAKSLPGIDVLHGVGALEPFLARSDVLILMAPLTAATQWIINQRTVAQLPRGAYLINVARGTLIDDNAVLQALDSGQLSGASLDVFATEPLPASHRYWTHQKVRITPHVSAITEVEPSADQVVAKIAAWAAGHAISGIVDPARGY
jgi:glyoxylate/hydroxypyruvate reductase